MKKMAKQLFVAAVALTAFTACSENTIAELDPNPIVDEPTPTSGLTVNSAMLTDIKGQQLTSVSSDFGTYYLDIKTDGAWYIETPKNMEFTPGRMYGLGSTRVPVYIGTNCAEARQLSYKVHFLNENAQARRAGEQGQTVTQNSNTNLEKFKTIINSNTFVGYGYMANKDIDPELCTGKQIFKMEDLSADSSIVKNSLSPTSLQKYFYAHSEDVLEKVISVNGHPGGNFNVVKFNLDLDKTDVTRQYNFETTIMQKSLTRSVYSRAIELDKVIRNASLQFVESNFTDGFKYSKKRFIDQLAAATDTTMKQAAQKEFFDNVGTHFVIKAYFGSELDYRMAVAKSKATESTTVKASLDFKWQQQVKDTAKVDSSARDSLQKQIPDSLKKNFIFHGGVMVTDSAFSAASATSAQVKARGGDVEKVNILATGGTLNCADLAEWLLGTDPEKATLTKMEVKPIYMLFNDESTDPKEKKAYVYLKTVIDRDYSLNRPESGFGTMPDSE